jgi:hypothetical protein
VYLLLLMPAPGAGAAARYGVLAACVLLPGGGTAVAVAKVEDEILILVTAVLGVLLGLKGADTLLALRRGATPRLTAATRPADVATDPLLQAELGVAAVALCLGVAVQWWAFVHRPRKRLRRRMSPLLWRSDLGTGETLQVLGEGRRRRGGGEQEGTAGPGGMPRGSATGISVPEWGAWGVRPESGE